MCSLCGILGANDHWADAAAREGVYTRNTDPMRRRRERADRGAGDPPEVGAGTACEPRPGPVEEPPAELGVARLVADDRIERRRDQRRPRDLARELLEQLDAGPG